MHSASSISSPRITLPVVRISSPRFSLALAPWDDPEAARVMPVDQSTPGLRYRLAIRRMQGGNN